MAELFKTIAIRVSTDFHKKVRSHLAKHGGTMQEFTMKAIEEKMQREGGTK